MKELFYLNKDVLLFEKIIIYGTGKAGNAVLLKLLQRDISVMCFAESNPDKCGTRILNIPVIHIDELKCERENAAVIVSGIHTFTIAEELEKRGFRHIFSDYGNEVGVIHLKREDI